MLRGLTLGSLAGLAFLGLIFFVLGETPEQRSTAGSWALIFAILLVIVASRKT